MNAIESASFDRHANLLFRIILLWIPLSLSVAFLVMWRLEFPDWFASVSVSTLFHGIAVTFFFVDGFFIICGFSVFVFVEFVRRQTLRL